jgi:hypothetical protein
MCRFLCGIALALVLVLLWPQGISSGFHGRAVELGIAEPTILGYEALSPSITLPMAALIWLVVLCSASYFTRRSGPKNRALVTDTIFEFGVCWALVGVLQWLFGAPFVTGDSGVYLRAGLQPWMQFGSHHPSGPGWILWFGSQLRLPVSATLAAVGALEILLLKRVFKRYQGTGWSWFLTAPFLVHPDLLIIRLSLWSEPGMLFILVLSVLVLQRYGQEGIRRVFLVLWLAFLFLVGCEMRHAGIFFLPGLAIAVALSRESRIVSRRTFSRIGLVAASLAALWMLLNVSRTGKPLQPSAGSFECVQYVAAYHRVPFCSTAPQIPLCVADPQGVWLKQANGAEPDFVSLDRFIFQPDSPLHSFAKSPEDSCALWGKIRSELLTNHKTEVFRLMFSRTIAQFGPWEVSERGQGINPPYRPSAQTWLDAIAQGAQKYLWILWIMWGLALTRGIATGRLLEPAILFLLLAALGHAAGIAINNPFLGLRYMAIPKYLVSLAAVLILIPRRSR